MTVPANPNTTNPNLKYTFTHTLDEVNQILLALAKLPFEEVVQLISKIHSQHQAQVVPVEPPKGN